MHMLLILLTLCLRKSYGVSYLFSIAYDFAGNRWRSGFVRIVNSGDVCRRNEVPVQWNVEGPQGPAGPPGPAGVDELFTTSVGGNNPIFLSNNQTSRVASLNVDAGTYLVLGTTVIGNLSSFQVDAICLLQPSKSGFPAPIGQVRLLESERSTSNIATAMVAIQMISSFSNPFTMVMDCTIPTPGGEGFVQFGRLSAIKVEVLHEQ
jgi:hypothetical protein